MTRPVLLLALVLGAGPALATEAGRAPESGKAAPLYAGTYTAIDGRPVAGQSLRGVALLVNFWARWCEPCRREIPILEELQHRHPRVQVVGIALEHDAAAVREFAQAYDMTYRILLAGEAGPSLLAALGNEAAGLPYSVAIRRDGSIAGRFLGVLSPPRIETILEALAAER